MTFADAALLYRYIAHYIISWLYLDINSLRHVGARCYARCPSMVVFSHSSRLNSVDSQTSGAIQSGGGAWIVVRQAHTSGLSSVRAPNRAKFRMLVRALWH